MDTFALEELLPSKLQRQLGEKGLLVHVETDEAGRDRFAVSLCLIHAPVDAVFREIAGIKDQSGGFLRRIPLVHKVSVLEDKGQEVRLRIDFRYKFLLASVKFNVVVVAKTDGKTFLDLDSIGGSIRDLKLRLRAFPSESGQESLFLCGLYFDIHSLGWLVDYFLKHHPEIESGIFSSAALIVARTLKEHMDRGKE